MASSHREERSRCNQSSADAPGGWAAAAGPTHAKENKTIVSTHFYVILRINKTKKKKQKVGQTKHFRVLHPVKKMWHECHLRQFECRRRDILISIYCDDETRIHSSSCDDGTNSTRVPPSATRQQNERRDRRRTSSNRRLLGYHR